MTEARSTLWPSQGEPTRASVEPKRAAWPQPQPQFLTLVDDRVFLMAAHIVWHSGGRHHFLYNHVLLRYAIDCLEGPSHVLVSIPVKLFRAARRERVRLHYVHRPEPAEPLAIEAISTRAPVSDFDALPVAPALTVAFGLSCCRFPISLLGFPPRPLPRRLPTLLAAIPLARLPWTKALLASFQQTTPPPWLAQRHRSAIVGAGSGTTWRECFLDVR